MQSELKAFLSQPLMMDLAFISLLSNYNGKTDGKKGLFVTAPDPKLMAESQLAAMSSTPKQRKCTAVLPLYGMIDQHGGFMLEMFGGTSLDSFGAAFDMLMNEDRVNNILIDVHSPGGTSYGVKAMADKIYSARGSKLVCSIANSKMASAAYYLGSAAYRVYAMPGSDIGSVGVYQLHFDESAAMAAEGIKATVVREPEFKAEGISCEPLTEQALASMQGSVHECYVQFLSDVAKYRGIESGVAADTFGKGRCLEAGAAVKAGMATRVATFEDVVGRMQSGSIRPGVGEKAAADEWDAPMMVEVDHSQMARRLRVALANL